MISEKTHRLKWLADKHRKNNISRVSIWMLILMLLFIEGCAVSYVVRANGYTDPSRPLNIEPNTPIYIVENTKAKNPLLEKEIIRKLENILKLKDCQTTEPVSARYYMLYGYGVGHERTITSTMPVYTPGKMVAVTKTGPAGTSYSTIQIPGTTSYVPYTTTVNDKWLFLKLVEGEVYRKEGKEKTVWVGEASITGERSDIRETINYLIAAIYEYFGRNTEKTVNVHVREDDPLIKKLMNRYSK